MTPDGKGKVVGFPWPRKRTMDKEILLWHWEVNEKTKRGFRGRT
jgi:hypothetical protein